MLDVGLDQPEAPVKETLPAGPTMAPDAFTGPAGELVDVISPYSEGDPVATLGHILVATGNLIGAGPRARVQHDAHPARLFAALVGPTSKGRKGLSWSAPRYVLSMVDPEWAGRRIASGLSSGEGLIYHVRDARVERQPVRKGGRVVEYQEVLVDHGETDKRLLAFEPELASLFKRMGGEGNSLSPVLRNAWDDHPLSTLTKNSPLRATGAHISVIGHVTAEELRLHLTEIERANGFGNRWLYLFVRRAGVLPDGAPVPDALLGPFIQAFRAVVEFSRTVDAVTRDAEATELWRSIYPALSEAKPGLLGAILGRAEAQVLRLSLIYALLDRSDVIRVPHLAAALAVWDYCDASARQIFGARVGFTLADVLFEALSQRESMTTTEIHAVVGRNRKAEEIRGALDQLVGVGKVHSVTRPTRGRTATAWEVIR
jgi:hypothetical protein